MEKELQEIRERLAQVDEWKQRREDIDKELAAVWTDQGESLEAPEYAEVSEAAGEEAVEATTA